MKFVAAINIAVALGTGAAAGSGPSAKKLARAVAVFRSLTALLQVREVKCEGFDEEPTEYTCKFQMRSLRGQWQSWSTYVAVDAQGYHLIDDISPVPATRPNAR